MVLSFCKDKSERERRRREKSESSITQCDLLMQQHLSHQWLGKIEREDENGKGFFTH